MWNRNIRTDYLYGLIKDAYNEYFQRQDDSVFENVISEFKKTYPEMGIERIKETIQLVCSSFEESGTESELVVTAPKSFRIQSKRTKETLEELIKFAKKSISITGYSISDYVDDFIDILIKKSNQGVYIKLYVNDLEQKQEVLDRLLAYRNKYLKVYEYNKQNDDKMSALHAKTIVVDSKQSLITSANLSYHGLSGNVEMGILVKSKQTSSEIEDTLKELIKMRVFTAYNL